jgi:hypothetical protein
MGECHPYNLHRITTRKVDEAIEQVLAKVRQFFHIRAVVGTAGDSVSGNAAVGAGVVSTYSIYLHYLDSGCEELAGESLEICFLLISDTKALDMVEFLSKMGI